MNNSLLNSLVSVIIPTYNRSDMIAKTLDSVWAQTYRPIEVLVVNDGSTDDTISTVTEWIAQHSTDTEFCCRLINQENSGGCAARNNGLRNATGKFIQFFDDDDELFPNAFQLHINHLNAHPERDASLGQAVYVHPSSNRKSKTDFKIEFYKKARLNRVVITSLPSPSFMIFRRNFLLENDLFWDEKLSCGQDTDLMVRTFISRLNLSLIPDTVCNIYIHDKGHISDKIKNNGLLINQYLISKWINVSKEHGYNCRDMQRVFSYFLFGYAMRLKMPEDITMVIDFCNIARKLHCNNYCCCRILCISPRMLVPAQFLHRTFCKLLSYWGAI